MYVHPNHSLSHLLPLSFFSFLVFLDSSDPISLFVKVLDASVSEGPVGLAPSCWPVSILL